MENNYKTVFDKIRSILGVETVEEIKEDEVVEVVETELETQEEVEMEDEPEIVMASATLEDGSVIYYDGDFAVELSVFADEAMETLLEDGDYVLENGDKFTIVNGVIGEIIPIVVEDEPEVIEDEPEVEALEEVNFEEEYNKLKVIIGELEEKLEQFNKQEVELKEEIDKLSTEPVVESITQKPQETVEMTAIEKRMAALNSIRNIRKK